MGPNASSRSPQRNNPGSRRLSIVFSLPVALIAVPRQCESNERVDEPQSIGPREVRERAARIELDRRHQRLRQPLGQAVANGAKDRPRALRPERRIPHSVVEPGPSYDNTRRRAALEARAHGDVGDVEHRRAAVSAVREEESAGCRRRPPAAARGQ
jgi:hypothetical protein